MSQALNALANIGSPYSKYLILRPLCTYGKDLVKQSIAPAPDFLLQNLKSAESPKNVLDMVSKHYSVLNSKHIMQALRSVFELQKQGNSSVTTKDLLRHPDFEKLCRKLRSQAGIIELNETIEALKVISYVGVPSDSYIVQVLLQLVRQNVNSLSLRHIMFLDFLLNQFKSSPLVDALKIALPLVFEIHLPVKIDRSNLQHLKDYLYFASRSNLSNKTLEFIVNELTECNLEFDAKSAKSIIWSITDMPPNDYFEPLLNRAINDLIVRLDDLTYTEIETTLYKLIYKYSKKYPFFYNEVFFDSCVNYVIDHDLGFTQAVYTLRKFSRVNYWNKHLIDYVTKKAVDNPDEFITKNDAVSIYGIVTNVALTEYRPANWDKLKELIGKCKNLAESHKREIIWLKFASSLCLLDIYKIDVLNKSVNVENLDIIFKKNYMNDFENYLTIWWSIKFRKPDLIDLLPSKYEPVNILKKFKEIDGFPLEGALQKALGGENYVMTNLVSRFGHQIDHAVLFRKGGFSIAVTENVQFIEDIQQSPDVELVLILCLRPIHYTLNSRIRLPIVLSMRILEDNGYKIVPVCLEIWENLSDFEKIPYIMQAINNKVSDDFNSKNIVQHL